MVKIDKVGVCNYLWHDQLNRQTKTKKNQQKKREKKVNVFFNQKQSLVIKPNQWFLMIMLLIRNGILILLKVHDRFVTHKLFCKGLLQW